MSTSVVVLDAGMSCADAWAMFEERGLRRAPVIKDGRVLGMINDRDLMRALPLNVGQLDTAAGERNPSRPLGSLLTRKLISVDPGAHLETAADLMLSNKIGGLLVTRHGKLVGIITESDLFRTFVSLSALAKGTRLTLHWPEGKGERADPTRIVLATGMRLHEYFEHPSPGEGLLVSLRVAGDGIEEFLEKVLDAGFLLLDRETS